MILSQISPGFTRKLDSHLSENAPGLRPPLFCQVETLVFGNAVERALRPERFIVGCRNPEEKLPTSYEELLRSFDCKILRVRYESAELAKISINVCLVASIGVANMMAEICEQIGADWSEIAPALKMDRRIGQYAYLTPGLGISGGNIERDLVTVQKLARERGTDASIVGAWVANSAYRKHWVLRKIHEHLPTKSSQPTIGICGLAYKPNTKSTKNSPAISVLEALRTFAVKVYDPKVVLDDQKFVNVCQVGSALETCIGADILAIMTPWAEFEQLEPRAIYRNMNTPVIIDPFRALNAENCIELGFSYHMLGARSF